MQHIEMPPRVNCTSLFCRVHTLTKWTVTYVQNCTIHSESWHFSLTVKNTIIILWSWPWLVIKIFAYRIRLQFRSFATLAPISFWMNRVFKSPYRCLTKSIVQPRDKWMREEEKKIQNINGNNIHRIESTDRKWLCVYEVHWHV